MSEKKVTALPILFTNGQQAIHPCPSIKLGHGYLLKGNEDVVSFYVDVRESSTGRAFPVSTSQTSQKYPSIVLETGEDGEEWTAWTEYCFPEFPGWQVFAVGGGKTLSICLRRDECNA